MIRFVRRTSHFYECRERVVRIELYRGIVQLITALETADADPAVCVVALAREGSVFPRMPNTEGPIRAQ